MVTNNNMINNYSRNLTPGESLTSQSIKFALKITFHVRCAKTALLAMVQLNKTKLDLPDGFIQILKNCQKPP